MRFWGKKGKKSKPVDDKETRPTDNDEIKTQAAAEDSSGSATSAEDDVKTETISDEIKESDETAGPKEETKEDISVDSKSKTDGSIEATIQEAVDSFEEVKPVESEETIVEAEKDQQEEYDDYADSGVFIFGKKIEGQFQKVFYTILTITLIPPTFLFGIALLVCIFLLLFPLVTIIMIAVFPATIFSFFILMAVLPAIFPAILIFLLITEKGKLSAFAEGKLLILKLYRWTLPTI